MFEFEYLNSTVQGHIENREHYLPEEVQRELDVYLAALRRDGVISKADFFTGDPANQGIIRISANTFELHYTVGSRLGTLKIIHFIVKSLDLLRDRFSINNDWDDKQVLPCIPQYDVPEKILRAVIAIQSGIDDSYELGWALDHRGSRDEFIVRHGNYAKEALDQLGLITRIQEGRRLKSLLTPRGLEIAQAPHMDTRRQLLTQAMLNYPPIWKIMRAVTEGGEELTNATVLKLIFPEAVRGADTSPRRAKTLRRWVTWIASYTGIPICQGSGTQLLLPIHHPLLND